MKYIAIASDGTTVTIECEGLTAFEVKAYGVRYFGEDSVTVTPAEDAGPATLRLKWAGDDYLYGGSPNARRLQFADFVASVSAWTDWRDAQ